MTKIYVYPETLRAKASSGAGYPHVAFEFVKRALPDNAKIHLYLPPGFSVPDSASYGNVDLGTIGASGDGGKLTKGETEDIATFGVGKFASNFGADAIFTKEKINDGIALNPNTVLQFDNVSVRSFEFTFKLVSSSVKEAEQALLIENMFRSSLYPELKSSKGLFLEYPPTFKIKFYHGDKQNTYMPLILESYLASMTTTYNAGSNMYHADGSPTEVDLSLTFTETKAITREQLYNRETSINNSDSNTGFNVDAIRNEIQNKIKSLF